MDGDLRKALELIEALKDRLRESVAATETAEAKLAEVEKELSEVKLENAKLHILIEDWYTSFMLCNCSDCKKQANDACKAIMPVMPVKEETR